MADLALDEREQAAVRAVLAAEPFPGETGVGEAVLGHLAALVRCDARGVVVVGPDRRAPDGRPLTHGVHHVRWAPDRDLVPGAAAADVLVLRVPRGDDVVQLWFLRRHGSYGPREHAVVGMLAPALERLMRARPAVWAAAPRLTVQERRVLVEVAAGLSNAEIAERLFVAPCTVRKHLENAYRKLGVSNRVAAVVALQHAPDAVAPIFA